MNVVVAVASERVAAWHGWCVEALRTQPGLTVRVVRVDAPAWRPPRGVAARLTGRALAPVVIALDRGDPSGADLVVDLTGADLDAAAQHGVWSIRLGASDDPSVPFARESAGREHSFEVVLSRRIDGRRERLRTGRFAVTRWHPSTVRLALREAARWPAILAGALASGVRLDAVPDDTAAPNRSPLSVLEQLGIAGALSMRMADAVGTALLDVVEWNVGFVDGGARRLLSEAPLEVRWLPAPERATFIADPFVAERDGVRALFVEGYDYERDRGVIDALVLDDEDRVTSRVRAIDIPTHLSYPYPVEIDGELYIIPENCAGNEVALYRCVSFPDRWEREVPLFPAFDGVDTTLFVHDGRWWAFSTRYSRGSTLALNAFYADSARGPWSPHALNPIVVDVSSARPAGQPFVVDGVLYRPGQNCTASYGCGLAIARIDELTPSTYRETIVRRHDGRGFGRWNAGFHTVSFSRDTVVVDGKRVYRDLRKLPGAAKKIAAAVRRLVRRRPKAEATFA